MDADCFFSPPFPFSLSNSFQAVYRSQSWKVGQSESDQGLDAFGRRFL